MQLDMLCIGAHADDVEIGMGGTVAKLIAQGKRVAICDLTAAEMSSNGTPEQRAIEAAEAATVLGVLERSCLHLPDCGLTAGSKEQVDSIVAEICRLQPHTVFAPYWVDRHPDHVAASALIEEAVFKAKLRHYVPQPHRVQRVIYYYINDQAEASLMMDVSEVYAKKIKALEAYPSQFAPVMSDRVETPLTSGYIERITARDRLNGHGYGWQYGEAFTTKQAYGVSHF